jgi:hypothetical protein
VTTALDLRSAAVAASVSIAVVTAPWTAVRVGPLAVCDLAVVATVVLLGPRPVWHFLRTAPWFLWLPVVTLVVLDLIPGRDVADRLGLTTALSLVGCWCVVAEGRPVGRVSWSALIDVLVWSAVASAAVAALAAVTDGRVSWPPTPEFPGRQAGLALHPTQLALSCVVALALVVFPSSSGSSIIGEPRRLRTWVVPIGAGCCLVLGLLASGSRAGLLVAAATVLVAAGLHLGSRAHDRVRSDGSMAGARIGFAVGAIVVVVGALVVVGLGSRSEASVAASDGLRRGALELAVDQARGAPLLGVGSDHLLGAHNVPLQLLAAGGVVLLATFVPLVAAAARDAWSRSPLGPSVAVLAWLAFSTVQNPLIDRFVHLLLAIAVLAQLGAKSPLTPNESTSS